MGHRSYIKVSPPQDRLGFEQQIVIKTDTDLLNIYKQHHEYQPQYITEVEKELQKRGIDYKPLKLTNDRRNEILDELLENGEPGSLTFIIIGFISALLGGLLGIIAGYVYSRSKRTSLSGNRYYTYDQKTRDYGSAMMWIGIVVFIVSVFIKFLGD